MWKKKKKMCNEDGKLWKKKKKKNHCHLNRNYSEAAHCIFKYIYSVWKEIPKKLQTASHFHVPFMTKHEEIWIAGIFEEHKFDILSKNKNI